LGREGTGGLVELTPKFMQNSSAGAHHGPVSADIVIPDLLRNCSSTIKARDTRAHSRPIGCPITPLPVVDRRGLALGPRAVRHVFRGRLSTTGPESSMDMYRATVLWSVRRKIPDQLDESSQLDAPCSGIWERSGARKAGPRPSARVAPRFSRLQTLRARRAPPPETPRFQLAPAIKGGLRRALLRQTDSVGSERRAKTIIPVMPRASSASIPGRTRTQHSRRRPADFKSVRHIVVVDQCFSSASPATRRFVAEGVLRPELQIHEFAERHHRPP